MLLTDIVGAMRCLVESKSSHEGKMQKASKKKTVKMISLKTNSEKNKFRNKY